MFGPCAKKRVQCLLIGASGKMYAGENLCLRPQSVCPRLPGEGYEKCKEVCGQLHHAEEQALAAAGLDAAGGTMYVAYHYCCADCTAQAELAGVSNIVCEEPVELLDVTCMEDESPRYYPIHVQV